MANSRVVHWPFAVYGANLLALGRILYGKLVDRRYARQEVEKDP